MSNDVGFEDVTVYALDLGAFDQDDLKVLSAMIQDAVLSINEISWRPKQRRVVLLMNRFRSEVKNKFTPDGRLFERVRSLFLIENVL